MTELYDYLEEIMPIKRVLFSLAVGIISLFIVLISGLTSDVVRSETIASRAFSAFSFTALASFILLMSGEEYAIFRTDRELERFIDDAPLAETGEDFDREEYLHEDEEEISNEINAEFKNEPVVEIEQDENFRPIDIGNFSNQN